MTIQPDLFTNVHKGIRRALFETCIALGRVEGTVPTELRSQLRGVLHFVHHHGENEDLLLLPLLAVVLPDIHRQIVDTHATIERALGTLQAQADGASAAALYHATCDFTALYLAHMREEELVLEPAIRAAVPSEELATFPRGSVARTPPGDAVAMLGWMLPAMPEREADELIARLPPQLQGIASAK